jgi:hypothetical protein
VILNNLKNDGLSTLTNLIVVPTVNVFNKLWKFCAGLNAISLIVIPVVVKEKSSPVLRAKYPVPGSDITVDPVNLQMAILPSNPDVPDVPLEPDDPLDPEDPLEPDVPLVPPEMLAVKDEKAI